MKPQEPGHGSLQRSFIQAKLAGHSEFSVHSGRQFGARPTKFGKHEQTGVSPTARHCEFGPHGLGTHGLVGLEGKRGSSSK